MARSPAHPISGLPGISLETHWVTAAPSGATEGPENDRLEQLGRGKPHQTTQATLGIGRSCIDEHSIHGGSIGSSLGYVKPLAKR
ncbi:hypothetical protein Rhsp01_34350 [Rhizobium sp. NBRC 114257]|uniref:Uncharacterized protein n=1 Tax=Rhizobium dioscoreae TaxID=2653122 RepID=A0ABQ0Z371_9HYPH|nr:hypothetical protein RsS93_25950 [Rhizobium dioscoreae]GLU82259.1 hypothetical protein Rhsp01_34350 [Rhizobium sp. NBRC 114257]